MCGDEVDELLRVSTGVQTGSEMACNAGIGPGLARTGPRGFALQN